jgi:hypothetical protein
VKALNTSTDRTDNGMTRERYGYLTRTLEARLTPEEVAAGWHFCLDWDSMLIHKNWPEAECCTCQS